MFRHLGFAYACMQSLTEALKERHKVVVMRIRRILSPS